MVYENCKIYGPYSSSVDGRLRVVVECGKVKTTVSYPKYLMECHLDRYLLPDETVDHIDCDFLNNEITNLRVLPRVEHSRIDAKRLEPVSFVCPLCACNFSLEGRRLFDAHRQSSAGKAGPFCSKQCAGRYGQSVQMCESNRIKPTTITKRCTTLKAELSDKSDASA